MVVFGHHDVSLARLRFTVHLLAYDGQYPSILAAQVMEIAQVVEPIRAADT